jgi:hypothetical protein
MLLLNKVLEELEVVEVDLMVKKKSYFNIKSFNPILRIPSFGGSCNVCNIEISKGEPYLTTYEYNICNTCLQKLAGELGEAYNKCEKAEEWNTAWLAEKITREDVQVKDYVFFYSTREDFVCICQLFLLELNYQNDEVFFGIREIFNWYLNSCENEIVENYDLTDLQFALCEENCLYKLDKDEVLKYVVANSL